MTVQILNPRQKLTLQNIDIHHQRPKRQEMKLENEAKNPCLSRFRGSPSLPELSLTCWKSTSPELPIIRILNPSSMRREILRRMSISILPLLLISRRRSFLCGELNNREIHAQMNIPGLQIVKDWRLGRNPGPSPRTGGEEDKSSNSSRMTDALSLHQKSRWRSWRDGTALSSFLRSSFRDTHILH